MVDGDFGMFGVDVTVGCRVDQLNGISRLLGGSKSCLYE